MKLSEYEGILLETLVGSNLVNLKNSEKFFEFSIFYDSYKACLLLIPFAIVDYQRMKKRRLEEQKRRLTIQFKSLMESLVTSLNAGYSLERAFLDAYRDLQLIYEKDELIFPELGIIRSGLSVNLPIEKLLSDFGNRSGIEDIRNFANVIMAAKKSGGNLIHIIQKTVNSITDKMEVEEEIETLITAKKLEERIMMVMPYGIIFYLRVTNGEFLEILYHNALGAILMTVFLMVIYLADIWAASIMEIRV